MPNDVGTDPFYNKPILVESSTTDTVTVNIGISSDTSEHTFVSATTNAISDVWYNYTYNSPKCERDTRYNLQGTDGAGGVLYDMRYGGNAQARYLASKYWINSTPQIDGDRQPEIAAKNFATNLINNYIIFVENDVNIYNKKFLI